MTTTPDTIARIVEDLRRRNGHTGKPFQILHDIETCLPSQGGRLSWIDETVVFRLMHEALREAGRVYLMDTPDGRSCAVCGDNGFGFYAPTDFDALAAAYVAVFLGGDG